jgi:hypothetical protein
MHITNTMSKDVGIELVRIVPSVFFLLSTTGALSLSPKQAAISAMLNPSRQGQDFLLHCIPTIQKGCLLLVDGIQGQVTAHDNFIVFVLVHACITE